MNEAEKEAFRHRYCPGCGQQTITVTWDKESSITGDAQWYPRDPRCTDRSCPMSDRNNWSLGDHPLEQPPVR